MHNQLLWTPLIYTSAGFVKENMLGTARALDIGCGGRKLPGALGMDILALPSVDVIHNVNKTPWPFEDNQFDLILLNHVLEHVDDVVAVMNELHRVLKPGGRVVIQVPYFRCVDAFNDPTHTHFFASQTLDYFVQDSKLAKYRYTNFLFRKVGFWYGWPHRSPNPFRRLFKKIMHRYPTWYDQYLSVLIPTECLTWELEAVK